MALIKCRECYQKVSTLATNCPHCGAIVHWKLRLLTSGGIGLVIAVSLILIFLTVPSSPSSDSIDFQTVYNQFTINPQEYSDLKLKGIWELEYNGKQILWNGKVNIITRDLYQGTFGYETYIFITIQHIEDNFDDVNLYVSLSDANANPVIYDVKEGDRIQYSGTLTASGSLFHQHSSNRQGRQNFKFAAH